MSITRAQTAKRLLNSIAPKGEKLAYINKKEAKLLKKMGGAGIDVNGTGIKSYVDFGAGPGSVSESLSEAAGVGSGYSGGNSGGGDGGSGGNFATINRGPKGPTRSPTDDYKYSPSKTKTNFARGANFLFNPDQLSKFAIDKQIRDQYEKDKQIASDVTGLLTSGYGQGIGSQYFGPVNNPMRNSYNTITGNIGPKGPPSGGGGDNNPILPILKKPINVPSDIEGTKSDFDLYAALEGREAMKFGENPFNMTGAMQRFSEGGEVTVDDAEKMALPGESLAYINEDEAALLKAFGGAGEPINQTGIPSYFFKKVFRKAKKAVKKVTKSKLGKAALLAAGAYFAPAAFGGTTGFGAGSTYGKFFSGLGGASKAKGFNLFNKIKSGDGFLGGIGNMFRQGGEKGAGLSYGRLGLGALGLSGLAALGMGGDEEEEETLDDVIAKRYKSDLDIPGIRKAALGYSKPNELYFTLPQAYRLGAADGGLTTIERVKQLFEERQRNLPEPEAPAIKLPSKEEKAMQKQAEEAMMEGVMYTDPEGNQMTSAEFQEAMRKITEAEEARDKKANGGTVAEAKVKMLIKKGADNDLIKTYVEGVSDSEIDQIRQQVQEIMRNNKAEGGLMDLGGKEMDLRGGGFVPLGGKEKADDVPARLSKNEFVFTADAVRAAGGGSVDKGAQKMYNTMKQLENKI